MKLKSTSHNLGLYKHLHPHNAQDIVVQVLKINLLRNQRCNTLHYKSKLCRSIPPKNKL